MLKRLLPDSWFSLLLSVCVLLLTINNAPAQTSAFTYQGKLADNGNPANGTYDFEFKLFDTVTVGTGTQQGSAVTVPNVIVTDGIFTVSLDFGVCASCFDGAARFLEIAVKPTSGSNFTTLSPRQPVTSTPYAIKSQNAATADGLSVACVNCITSSQIQSVQGSQVTGDIAGSQINGAIPVASVPAGSANYIQNGNSQQASTNFNIGGTGTAGILNATTQFNLGGSRVLSSPGTRNLFVGVNAGTSNSTGTNNSFVGSNAGLANTTGGSHSFFGANAGMNNSAFCCNAFFGSFAGANNTTGTSNSFFGDSAGENNSTGLSNSFFGHNSGLVNTTANSNSFFGESSGQHNTVGAANSFFGTSAGSENTTGNSNAFFGTSAGSQNTTGSDNTFIGRSADFNTSNPTGDRNTLLGGGAKINSGVSNATAIGALSQVTQSNALILGAINGVNGATANTNVGIGTTAPTEKLHVVGNGLITGTLTGSIVNAATQYNVNGLRAFTVNGAVNNSIAIFTASNTFAGDGAGLNTTPDPNPTSNVGKFNSFYGAGAGQTNTTGSGNAFFGSSAGVSNNTGNGNSFFGDFAGSHNTTGCCNVFFGDSAGYNNTTSNFNIFIGLNAGFNMANPTGDNNTLPGTNTIVTSGISNATAIGANASVSQSDSLVLGTSSTNVGIGTTAPARRLHLKGVGSNGLGIGDLLVTGTGTVGAALTLESTGTSGRKYSWISTSTGADAGAGKLAVFDATAGAYRLVIDSSGNVGIGTTAPLDLLHAAGDIRVGTGTTGCVKDANGTVIAGSCSSDARFKRDIVPFAHLLDKVAQLQPVHFHWRSDEFKDRHFGTKPSYGLIAQEVEKVLPELVTEDEQGYKAVNYSKLPLLTLQAVKELKAENDQLKKENEALRQQQLSLEMRVKALTQLVCKTASNAEICKP